MLTEGRTPPAGPARAVPLYGQLGAEPDRRGDSGEARRVDLMLALPIDRLARHALEHRLKAIGKTVGPEHDPHAHPIPPDASRSGAE